MRQIELHIDPIPVDADGLAVAQAVAGAQALTLNGALIVNSKWVTDSVGTRLSRRIGILSAGNDAGITFAVVGFDPDGKAQTESVTGANAGTAESTGYWSEITSVTSSGAAAGNVSVGTVDEFATQTIPIDVGSDDPAAISLERFGTPAIDVTIQVTKSRVQYTDSIEFETGPTSLQGATAATSDDIDNHASGFRLICNSYTTAAELRCICNTNRS